MPTMEQKQVLKRIIAGAGRLVRGLSRAEKGGLAVILNYHSVHPEHPTSTKPGDFEAQMGLLAANFTVISLTEFCRLRSGAGPLPARCAAVTFDDGYEDNFLYAFPALKKYGVPAAVFLATGFIEGKVDIAAEYPAYRGLKPMSWEQIGEMKKSGIEFGGHTHAHPDLARVPPAEAEADLLASRDILRSRLGECRHFAYPFGMPKNYNAGVIAALKRLGFESACTAVMGTAAQADLFELPRIRIDAVDSFSDFSEKINGDWNYIGWIQRLKSGFTHG